MDLRENRAADAASDPHSDDDVNSSGTTRLLLITPCRDKTLL
jgi:hypothetical protein